MKLHVLSILSTVLVVVTVSPNRCGAETYAYVVNSGDGSVSVIHTGQHEIVETINNVGKRPHASAVSPLGDYVFVVGQEAVTQIRTSDHKSRSLATRGSNLRGVCFSPNGELVYSTSLSEDKLYGMTTSGEVPGAIRPSLISDMLLEPSGLVVAPGKDRLYVANQAAAMIAVIDISAVDAPLTLKDVELTPVDISKPVDMATTSNGDYVYATNESSDTVSVIRTSDDQEIASIEVEARPIGIAVTTTENDGHCLYVANSGSNSVSVIQIQTNPDYIILKTGGITHPDLDEPYGVSATPNGQYVYVTNKGNDKVSVIQTSNDMIVETIKVGSQPTGLGSFIGSLSAPDPPGDVTVTTGPGKIIAVSWSDISYDELGFTIERKKEGDEDYEEISTVSLDTTSYEDTEIEETTTYFYQVSSFNDVGNSEYGSAQIEIFWDPPSKLSVRDTSKDCISLSWKDNSNVESGFEIERRTVAESNEGVDDSGRNDEEDTTNPDQNLTAASAGSTKTITLGPNTNSYLDRDVESGTTYNYRIRAYTASGEDDEKEYSDYSNKVRAETTEDYLCFIGTASHRPTRQDGKLFCAIHGDVYVVTLILMSSLFIIAYRLESSTKGQ